MLKHRIIPILYFNEKMQVVQTKQFGRPYRPMGTMRQYIKVMESRNVDEIILIDLEATEQERMPKFEAIKEFASDLFCPVTYGGGISKLEDAEKLITECGVDKVAIKTNYKIIPQIVEKFGSQAVVGIIDYKIGKTHKSFVGLASYLWVWSHDLKVGEILLTSIYRNGEMMGYDVEPLSFTSPHIKVPIIINGGCGDPSHMIEAINNGADAVAASTMFLLTEHTPKDCARALDAAGVAVRVDG